MVKECDEPGSMGQVAGTMAIMSALVKALPPATRRRLQRQILAEFGSLLSAMPTTSEPNVQADWNSVKWMRDLFLKKIEQADSKQTAQRISKERADPARMSAPDNRSAVVERPASTDVDFEL